MSEHHFHFFLWRDATSIYQGHAHTQKIHIIHLTEVSKTLKPSQDCKNVFVYFNANSKLDSYQVKKIICKRQMKKKRIKWEVKYSNNPGNG